MSEDDTFVNFRQKNAGVKTYKRMIKFLRDRYATRPGGDGDVKFFRVAVITDNRREIGLYFEKSSLYLRGWTVGGQEPATAFMAAWDNEEWARIQGGDRGPIQALPAGGAGYLGPPPGGYISLRYSDNDNAKKPRLSRAEFFTAADKLYDYLADGAWRTAPEPKRAEVQGKLHLLAKMTSEMARFDPYHQLFAAQWNCGVDQNMRPSPSTHWTVMPRFDVAHLKWQKFSKKAVETESNSEAFELGGIKVTKEMAEEVLGKDGARC
ncbi:ribosome-inactivating family protein [Nocardia bovistercoris]|uniref:Uncharacterized protein n=1 Tax=Nocardia bovistercoris TaxID=2785916 RepID=A0A931IGS1_9NOCA|nr:ribosome-inactivating family protein [Nocardia bovistercoris]MBH0779470.1 hypothetical protein [Nocardia bovistercoris]